MTTANPGDRYNNCFTPWPDMGQAIRVYATDGPSPTLSSHHVLVLSEVIMGDHAESVIPLRTANTKANGSNIGEIGDPMYTLDTTGSHAVVYNIFGGNKRKDRPDGGFYVSETEQTKTLDAVSGLNPTANQGGVAIVQSTEGYVVCFDGQRTDDFRVYPDVFPALLARMGTGGNNVPLIAHDIAAVKDDETR
jgi:hypothetical protein